MAKSLIDRGARLSDKLALAILPACCVEGVFARASRIVFRNDLPRTRNSKPCDHDLE